NDGLGLTTHSQTKYVTASGYQIITNTLPDGSYAVSTNQNGRLISVTKCSSTGAVIAQTTFGYDPHGRRSTSTDARNGVTTYYFNNADQNTAIRTPSPDGVQAGQLTTNLLDSAGRVIQSTLPDASTAYTEYFDNGLVKKQYGSRQYPAEYTYDAQG